MSRQESEREDLLREATALVERVELNASGCDEPIVCGFRRDGAASFYFGADPAFHFNVAGQLRRAYVAGRLIKAERGRLIALTRERSEQEVALVRHELATDEVAAIIADLACRFERLERGLHSGDYSVTGLVTAEADVDRRVFEWLRNRPRTIAIAEVPNAC